MMTRERQLQEITQHLEALADLGVLSRVTDTASGIPQYLLEHKTVQSYLRYCKTHPGAGHDRREVIDGLIARYEEKYGEL